MAANIGELALLRASKEVTAAIEARVSVVPPEFLQRVRWLRFGGNGTPKRFPTLCALLGGISHRSVITEIHLGGGWGQGEVATLEQELTGITDEQETIDTGSTGMMEYR